MPAEFDEIHKVYVRMTEITDAILSHPKFRDVATHMLSGELLGLCHELGNAAAKLKIFTESMRHTDYALHQLWEDVLKTK